MKIATMFLSAVVLFFFCHSVLAETFGHSLCKEAKYKCYVVKRGDTWDKLFPDPRQKDLVMRINRINVHLERGMRIAIPKDDDLDPLDYSPFAKQIDPPGRKIILVSIHPSILAWGAYDSDGSLQFWGPVSGGRGYCPDLGRGCHTSTGHFAIYQKEGRGCVSSKFPIGHGGAPMPWCMFFHGGFALHGSYEVPGYNASHGCVRIFIPDAKWLNQEFTSGEKGVPVIISNQI